MKKFIKAVIVASVLVSASSAFATLPSGGNKAAANGTGSTDCPMKANPALFAVTNELPKGATSTAKGPVKSINGTWTQ